MSIYDGDSTSADLMVSLDGGRSPDPVVTTGSNVYITFRADYVFVEIGFVLQIELGNILFFNLQCGNRLYTS